MTTDRDPSKSDSHRQAIEATAAVWLSLRDRGMTPAETEGFVRWLQEDEEHAAVFASLDQTWGEFDRLAAVLKPGASASPDTLAPRYRRRFAKLPLAALSAAAALAIVCFGIWELRGPRYFAETPVGGLQKVDLPDGSVALLNTDSAIDVDMADNLRRVRVVRGEVNFSVRHNAEHPFVVSVDGVQVRDVGTVFDVRSRSATVEILVTEGSVDLQTATAPAADGKPSAPLVAGERAVVLAAKGVAAPAGKLTVSHLSDEEMRRALAWQERRLEFDATPLGEVVAEFNRYNRTKLVVADSQLAARPFSGTFRADGYEALVGLLEDDFGVVATRRGGEIFLAVK